MSTSAARRWPVLSTSRCRGLLPRCGCARGTSSALTQRLKVEWSGTARTSPSRPMTEPIRPSSWRKARRNAARGVSAVRIARGE